MNTKKPKDSSKVLKNCWNEFMEDLRIRGIKALEAGIIPPTPIHMIELVVNSVIAQRVEENTPEEDSTCNIEVKEGMH